MVNDAPARPERERAPHPPGEKTSVIAVASWATYDFADTIFSATCVTLFFPPYLMRISGRAVDIGTANVISMIAAGLVLPIAGSLVDRTGRAKRWLFFLTAACCGATALLSAVEPAASNVFCLVALFAAANFAYQVALLFYNSLLPAVAPARMLGFVSGLGVGLGYAGIIFSLFSLALVVRYLGMRYVFSAAAAMFFAFALPLFFFVPERALPNPVRFTFRAARDALKNVWQTDRSLKKRRGLLFFFLGNFLIVDALNTAIVYFALYIENVFGKGVAEILPCLLAFYGAAFAWGILQGRACDLLGARPVYLSSAVTLACTVVFYSLARSEFWFFLVLIAFGSFALAGVWTAGRKMLVDLSEPRELGALFGLYGMTGRLSAYGTIFFGLLADALGFRLALLSLLTTSVPGIALLWRARKEPPQFRYGHSLQ